MADNSSIAFQIYQAIDKKQKEYIAKKTIKQEDIIEISEESFIEELQDTVNFYTKGIADNNIIGNVYKSILKRVDTITDINQFTTSSGIKIPGKIILESIDVAIGMENNNITTQEDVKELENTIATVIATFMLMESLDDKIKYYESLSSDEKREVRRTSYKEIFGEQLADEIIKAEDETNKIKETDIFQSLDEREQEEVLAVINLNDPFTYIAENLGIESSKIDTDIKRIGLTEVLKDILDRAKLQGIEKTQNNRQIIENLQKLGLSEEECKSFIENFKEKYKNDPDFYLDMTRMLEREEKREISFHTDLDAIIQLVREQGGLARDLKYEELRELFMYSYDANGELSFDTVATRIQMFQNEYGRYQELIPKKFKKENLSQEQISRFSNQNFTKTIVSAEATEKEYADMISQQYEGPANESLHEILHQINMDENRSDRDLETQLEKFQVKDKLFSDLGGNLSDEIKSIDMSLDFSSDDMALMLEESFGRTMSGEMTAVEEQERSMRIPDGVFSPFFSETALNMQISNEQLEEERKDIPIEDAIITGEPNATRDMDKTNDIETPVQDIFGNYENSGISKSTILFNQISSSKAKMFVKNTGSKNGLEDASEMLTALATRLSTERGVNKDEEQSKDDDSEEQNI